MKLALISDTHFGDPDCRLAHYGDQATKSNPVIGSLYEQFRAATGQDNDFLIVLGDILDFSVCSYRESFDIARAFFRQVQIDKIAQSVIYVPGNHDADIWHLYEYEVNVIRRIAAGKAAQDFRYSVPGLIDGRQKVEGSRFRLHGIKSDGRFRHGYGGTFIDSVTVQAQPDGTLTGEPMNFALAYPNLYLLTDSGSVLMTHGHYLEEYWSMLGEWAVEIAGKQLGISGPPTIKQLVELNFPFNQLACSGSGQAGALTDKIVLPLQRDARNRDSRQLEKYLDGVFRKIDQLIPGKYLIDEFVSDAMMKNLKRRVVEFARSVEPTRYNEKFVREARVQERFKRYFNSCKAEIAELFPPTLSQPQRLVFGHTHRPIPWDYKSQSKSPVFRTLDGHQVHYCNLGGWLQGSEIGPQDAFCGAEVLTFDSDTQTIKSQSIR
ncbi:MAG: metallophosphoesterase [Candidatus Zixiibacteriota bacterium]